MRGSSKRKANPSRRRRLTAVRRKANPARRRRTSVARRRNPSLNWQRIGLQTGGLVAGAFIYNKLQGSINDMLANLPGSTDAKTAGMIKIVAGGAIVALGDYLASMPNIARGAAGTLVPSAALALGAMVINDGVQGAFPMEGTRRRHMRGTIVRSPMIASQVMRGTARLGPGAMRGSLEVFNAPQAALERMQGTHSSGHHSGHSMQGSGMYNAQCI
jgi:hypothetical protein